MAEPTHHQAGLQHLAHRRQEDSAHPVVLVHQRQQVALAEAGLEAHLQQQLTQRQVGAQLQSQLQQS